MMHSSFKKISNKSTCKTALLGSCIAMMFSVTTYAQAADGPFFSGARDRGNAGQMDRSGSPAKLNFGQGRFEVTRTITGITTPHGVNVMPLQKKLWVSNESTNTASRIDIASGNVEMVVPVGEGPDLILTDKLRQKVWITNLKDNSVSVLNANTGEEMDRVAVGNEPHGLAIDQARGMVYVANYKDNNITVLNARTNEKMNEIPVGKEPRNITLDILTGNIYVTNMGENTVSMVNPQRGKEILRMKVGAKPVGLDFNMMTRTLYVGNSEDGTISILRNGQEVKKISVGANPRAVLLNLMTNQLFVNLEGESATAVIDGFTDRVRQKVPVGEGNYVASLDITTNTLYVANGKSNSISVISARDNSGRSIGGGQQNGSASGPLPGFFERDNGGQRTGDPFDGEGSGGSLDLGDGLFNR